MPIRRSISVQLSTAVNQYSNREVFIIIWNGECSGELGAIFWVCELNIFCMVYLWNLKHCKT